MNVARRCSTDEPSGALHGLHEAPTRAAAPYQQLLPGSLRREMVPREGRHGNGVFGSERGATGDGLMQEKRMGICISSHVISQDTCFYLFFSKS